jgi:hypothetical protein
VEDDGGDQGGPAGGEQDVQGQIDAAPGSILSPGNSPLPPESCPGSRWTKNTAIVNTTQERQSKSAKGRCRSMPNGETLR